MRLKMIDKLLIFSALFIFYFISALKIYNIRHASGDEPEYLVTAYSLINDHDLDIKNNAYLFFLHETDNPSKYERLVNIRPDSRLPRFDPTFPINAFLIDRKFLPYHSVSFSVLLAPFMIRGSFTGTRLFLAIIAALVGVNIYLLLKSQFGTFISLVTTVFLVLNIPLAIFSHLAFTEIFAALMIIYLYRKLTAKGDLKGNINFGVFLLIAFFPWLHTKYALLSLIFLAFILDKGYKKKNLSDFTKGSLIFFLSVALLLIFTLLEYQNLKTLFATGHPGVINPFRGFLGLLFDKEHGLLPYAPVYLLSIFGLYEIFKKPKQYLLLIVLLSAFLLNSFFAEWFGGSSPPSRFFTPFAPLMSIPLATFIKRTKRIGLLTGFLLFSLGLIFLLTAWFKTTYNGFEDNDGKSFTFRALPYGERIDSLLPSYK